MTRHVRSLLLVGLLLFFSVIQIMNLSAQAVAKEDGADDLFGMAYDSSYGSRTNYIPANTQGLQLSYQISTTGVTCGSSSGWVAVVDSALIAGGSPDLAWLQASLALGCTGSGSSQWNIQYGWVNNTGYSHMGNTIASLSTSSYPSLSGTIEIYYTGSCWTEKTYVSQNSNTYTIPKGGCYPTIQGTTVSGQHDDWTCVETDLDQVGVTFGTSFVWTVNNPGFLVSGLWQFYDYQSGRYEYLYAYAVYQPNKSGNTVGVEKILDNGVNVYVGSSLSDGTLLNWQIAPGPS